MNEHNFTCLISKFVPAVLLALGLGACSIHPLTEDVTSLNTFAIVQKIRCEAKRAIIEQGVGLIDRDEDASSNDKQKWARFLEDSPEDWRRIPPDIFSRKTRNLIDKYDQAFMYLDFTFTINEENNLSSEINLLSTLTRGTDALNIKSSSKFKRQNVRNFRVQDTFASLLEVTLPCKNRSTLPDPIYPVTGEIGLSEVVNTFLLLNESRSLRIGDDKARLFADTLTFTTTLSGSANPKIVLSPVGKALSIADAGFTAEAIRMDMHQVLVGLSLPAAEIDAAVKALEQGPPPSPRRPRHRLVVSKSVQSDELNGFMDFQIRKNILMNAVDARPVAISLF